MVKFCPTTLVSTTTVNGVTNYVYQGYQCSGAGPVFVTIQRTAPIPQPWGTCANGQMNCVELGPGPSAATPGEVANVPPAPPENG